MISILSLENTEKTNSNGLKSKVHPKLQGVLKTGYLNCYIQGNFEHLSCFIKWFHCRLYKTNKNVKFDNGVPGNLVRVRVPPKQFLNSPNETFIIGVISSSLLPLSVNTFIFISLHIK